MFLEEREKTMIRKKTKKCKHNIKTPIEKKREKMTTRKKLVCARYQKSNDRAGKWRNYRNFILKIYLPFSWL